MLNISEMRTTYGDDMIAAAAAMIADERFLRDGSAIRGPDSCRAYLRERLRALPYESFSVIFLDNHQVPISTEEMSRGTYNETGLVYPREVARRALALNAAGVILAHNHPCSGVPKPSPADKHLTSALKEALSVLDIKVYDHLIIGQNDDVSFLEEGLISQNGR